MGRILIVDEDRVIVNICEEILKQDKHTVRWASNWEEVNHILSSEEIDLMVIELILGEMDGIEIMRRAKQLKAGLDAIIITDYPSIDTAVKAFKIGALDYIKRPFNADEFRLIINSSLERKKLLEEHLEIKGVIKFLEIIRSLSSALEIDVLYEVSLNAFIQATGLGKGIFYLLLPEGFVESKAWVGIDESDVRKLKDFFERFYTEKIRSCSTITPLGLWKAKDAPGEISRSLFVPIRPILQDKKGFIILISEREQPYFNEKDIKNISLLSEYANLSFENALKFMRAQEQAFTDDLTQLYNARYLDIVLDKEIKRCDRYGIPLTLLFIDLDYLKKVNDVYGHIFGSKVISEAGRLLKNCVRETDILSRYGGDEFIVILIETDEENGYKVGERIRSAVEKHIFLKEEGLNIRMTASIGVATYPRHARSKHELLDLADKAMYEAKTSSRNAVFIAAPRIP